MNAADFTRKAYHGALEERLTTSILGIAGNIGVGKSSFTELFCRRTGYTPAFEPVEENPYLADFYRDMQRWGFHSQVFFLSRRIRQHHDLALASSPVVVQDRSLYEDAEVFAKNLHLSGQINDRDWSTYECLYQAAATILPPPKLIVYLKASLPTLKARIELRGRAYEAQISDEYLTALNELYDSWAKDFRRAEVLTIDTDRLDFVARGDDLDRLVETVESRLTSTR